MEKKMFKLTKLDYVVSSNINKFVADAVENVQGFADKTVKEQKVIIYKMAADQIAEQTTSLLPKDTPPE